METPSEALAKRIITRLIKEKLISEDAANKLLPGLGNGKLRPEDWRLSVELSDRKELKQ